ncbi:polynucleotide kinase-phosphatase [Hugenholtzia roseola]|uniref:polynucleotide kinase-phosphatase n=1 Tax=Hugenholtzia roseola TaxID=1002 RepID=UPI00041BF4E8|nr:polynucleotide kinase-phosphatase [Hugenholtzia roseola]
MEIKIPEFALVVLIGVSGSGKSSFAKKHFKDTEVLSSDQCRAWVCDDPNDQTATTDAFETLYYVASKRLKRGLLTVIDATNVQAESRKGLIELARTHHCLPLAIVLDLPFEVCEKRNQLRPDRNFGSHVVRQQAHQLKKSLRSLEKEGFRQVYRLNQEQIDAPIYFKREKLYNDKREDKGAFDIIGDIHGCFDELETLLSKLGYQIESHTNEGEPHFGFAVTPPPNRKAIFLGDLVDRGTDSPKVLKLVMSMVKTGVAYCVPGNHDIKLQKYLRGQKVQLKHGLELTVKQLEGESKAFRLAVEKFIYGLISHYVLDEGKLVVAHAGLIEEMQGRASGAVRAFCLYGETTGEIDEFGLPVRHDWAKAYRGKAKVIYGHTPIPQPEWLNRTLNIDTGCVFGGKLTALRYPEGELISVDAKKVYCEPVRPITKQAQNPALSSQQIEDDLLHLEDVSGKRIIQTRLRHNITLRQEGSIAALEVMSRFAINPKWLIYLPPTMSPCATSDLPEYLEYPTQALNYYKKREVRKVICQEKHMGSRAVLVVCRDEAAALRRFGVENEGIGVCYTRTGRSFFSDTGLEKAFLERVALALTKANFWENFKTDWVCLDAELLPWSAKAQALLKEQYAAVGAAAGAALPKAESALLLAAQRGIENAKDLLVRFERKKEVLKKYVEAYRQYCWQVESLDDYKLAPFHLLATEGAVHLDQNHEWHLTQIAEIARADSKLFLQTAYQVIDFEQEGDFEKAQAWWLELTQKGGEGMVVKPYDFIAHKDKELLQPAVKCRGKEYLRIIYGAEYDLPHNLERLKSRGLSQKRSLALREFALGIEALERFVRKEPLRRIHESVFAVLALESEAIDPRL